jgi:hypothetical protein
MSSSQYEQNNDGMVVEGFRSNMHEEFYWYSAPRIDTLASGSHARV